MPYGVSPQVIYYNKNLVDFDRMAARGLDVPTDHRQLDLGPVPGRGRVRSRARARGTKGVSIAPTLGGLAPFIYSGGGNLFDDDDDPTSLAFASDDTQSALETMLTLLRDPS